ncbi:MAG: cytochrome c oxidase subunit I [Microvirga sp.]
MTDIAFGHGSDIPPPAELEEVELYHPHSWWTTYVFSQDAKTIAIQYSMTALAIGLVALVISWLMRLQLGFPGTFSFIDPSLYLQMITMHGMIMVIYLLTALFLGGFGNYLIPLMVGARDMVFPYVNMLSYWIYLLAVLVLVASFFVPGGPTGAGWTLYPPQAILPGTPGYEWGIILMLISLIIFIIGFTMGGLNYVVTVLQARTRGMTLMRLPLTVWGIFTATVLALLAFPALFVGAVMMLFDRLLGTSFFMPSLVSMGEQLKYGGGSPILFQHLFWFFGHPEVYIIFIPATGIVSTILAPFTRRETFGYLALVLSLVATGFIGFGLWVHHMFATGLPQLGASFFTAASIMIAIPSGVQIFCWLATLWTGRLLYRTPLLYVLGFIFTFVIGGLTGVMLAAVPLDLQVHDTFFVVAHFHYVLIGGAVFPLLGGLFYWFPKMTGRLLSEGMGKVSFWLVFLGFNLTFFPQHILGLQGMPRRVYTYLPETGWGDLNLLSTMGGLVLTLGVLTYVGNMLWSLAAGLVAGDDPWASDTLEWATSSPPPPYNFQYLPTVDSRYPLWTRREDQPVVTGLRTDRREVLVTDLLDAEPDHRDILPGPTIWPFVLGIGIAAAFIISIFTPAGVLIGAVPCLIALIAWFWPRGDMGHRLIKQKTIKEKS